MSFKIIQFKVIFSALLGKIKKIFNSDYTPYYPLEKKLNLSPSDLTLNEYKSCSLSLSFSKSKFEPLRWQALARKKLIEVSLIRS